VPDLKLVIPWWLYDRQSYNITQVYTFKREAIIMAVIFALPLVAGLLLSAFWPSLFR